MRRSVPNVLFATAAGPSIGFGHLVRSGHLAGRMRVTRQMALRGPASALDSALGLGWTVHRGSPSRLAATLPDLIVVDDPSAVEMHRWVRAARRYGVPVATIHDGWTGGVHADLMVDGSFMATSAPNRQGPCGPAFAILDPAIAERRDRSPRRRLRHVLVALGGGRHVRTIGVRIADELSHLVPDATIDLAAGFCGAGRLPPLPARCQWLVADGSLADALASTTVGIVAGGVTLYEACALGTPIVTVPVVPGQQRATRAAARRGLALEATVTSAAAEARRLLDHPTQAAAMGRRARRAIDGLGTVRVAGSLHALLARVGGRDIDRAA
jgi:spore coat polysaccharide biosynthesis predicted glycosyltransferase SpsG